MPISFKIKLFLVKLKAVGEVSVNYMINYYLIILSKAFDYKQYRAILSLIVNLISKNSNLHFEDKQKQKGLIN